MRNRSLLAIAVFAAAIAACSSAATEPAESAGATVEPAVTAAVTESADPTPSISGNDPSPDFCVDATSFITDSRIRFITTPDADVFVEIDTWLRSLGAQSPDEVAGDITALRDGFEAIDEAYATTGYDPTAALTLPVEVQESNLRASRNLERYLIDSCGLAEVRTEQIDQIAEAFGIDDLTMAECLHTQMGNIAGIEASTLTPELMTTEVCGTSIFGLLSGATANE